MNVFRVFRRILALFLIFVLVCAIFPPLFRKTLVSNSAQESVKNGSPERVRVIEDNEDALLWRLRLIENAQERIILSTFEFWDDQSGTDVMAALAAAADRGIQVSILLDGLGCAMHLGASGHFRELADNPNVTVKLYNPLNLLKPCKVNYRLHDKYLIADDFAYILGGRNTGDLFLGSYAESHKEDRDILVYEPEPGAGTSYVQLLDYFERIWALPCCKEFRGYGKADDALKPRYQQLVQQYPQAFQPVNWERETILAEGVTLLHGDPEPHNKEPVIWDKMVEYMKEGQDVVISTPYIICDKAMYQSLRSVTRQGTSVRMFVNAVESGANPFGCTDYLNQKSRILGCGVDIFEYWGEQSLHTKTVLVDDHISIVGSCNADIRSVYLDTELMLVIESQEVNSQLRQYAGEMEQRSILCRPDGTEITGENYPEGALPFWKNMLFTFLRVLIIPLRHLL